MSATKNDELMSGIVDDILGGDFKVPTKSKPEEAVKKVFKVTANKGQKLYSELFPSHTIAVRDHAITMLKAKDIPDALSAFVNKEDANYVPPQDACEAILAAFEVNDRILISGNPGTGKSSLIQYLCAKTGRPFIRINASGDMDSSHLFGQLVVENGATVWKDGPVTEAVRHGGVLLWDEWDVTPPEIAMTMQWLLEEGGKLYLKEMPGTSLDKMIEPHAEFRIVCSGNTLGQGDETSQFAGTAVQNTASLDRFGTVLKLDYLASDLEVELICGKVDGIKKADARKMVKVANIIRTSYEKGEIAITMSPRTLLSWARKAVYWEDLEQSLRTAFGNKLNQVDYKTLRECVYKVYSINI